MILADTSVWIDHLRKADTALMVLLDQMQIVVHPFVIGELALGPLANRQSFLSALRAMPLAVDANDPEVLQFIEANALHGKGIGYIDAHLLVSVRLTPETRFWTRDKRLRAAAAASEVPLYQHS